MIIELEQLKKLLWEEWDPIGVNYDKSAIDEYDSYALRVFSMLKHGKNEEDILNYLNYIEAVHMGLELSGNNPKIVGRIFEVHRSFA
jgi:hypothetical protein